MADEYIVVRINEDQSYTTIFTGTMGKCDGYIVRCVNAAQPSHLLKIIKNTDRAKSRLERGLKKLPKIS